MARYTAAITGVGGYVPETKLTNFDLEKLVDTNNEWIVTRTGIKERRILKKEGKASSYMAVEAVKDAFRKTKTDPKEIDVIICATVTPDMRFPDTANTIAKEIGATNAWGFDLGAACSGFLFGLTTAARFVESGAYQKVLVIGVDMMSSIVNYEDRSTCILFGDGAGCVIVERSPNDNGFVDADLHGDGSGAQYLNMKGGGSLQPFSADVLTSKSHYVFQDGRPVFKAAVNGMRTATQTVLERNNVAKEDIDWVVPHQANMRIINTLVDFLDIPSEKVMVNIDRYGNTTAATLPLCLWDYENQLKSGDKLIFTAFGGGFTWGSIYLTWAYDSN